MASEARYPPPPAPPPPNDGPRGEPPPVAPPPSAPRAAAPTEGHYEVVIGGVVHRVSKQVVGALADEVLAGEGESLVDKLARPFAGEALVRDEEPQRIAPDQLD